MPVDTAELAVALTVRDLTPVDLPDLTWSGGTEHLRHVAALLPRIDTGEVVAVVAALRTGQLVGMGVADLVRVPDAGLLMMLAVRESWQSLGVGTLLVGALEQRIAGHGLGVAKIGAEHDNPRAATLYRRLGYLPYGTELDGWSVGERRTYVTVNVMMARRLVADPQS